MSIHADVASISLTALVARKIRGRLGEETISRAELARRLEVDETWVGKRLNGRTEITLSDLERIVKALGTTPGSLLSSVLSETKPSHPLAARHARRSLRPIDRRPSGRSRAATGPTGQRRTSVLA